MKSHLYFLQLSLSDMLFTVYFCPGLTVMGQQLQSLNSTGETHSKMEHAEKCHNKILTGLGRFSSKGCRKGIRKTVKCLYFKRTKTNEVAAKLALINPSPIFML